MSGITIEQIQARVAQVNDAAVQPMRANALELLLYVDVLETLAAFHVSDDFVVATMATMASEALKAKPQLDLESAR